MIKRALTSVAAIMLFTLPAAATGGFSCTAADSNLEFAVEGTTGRGMGLPIIGIMAKATLKAPGIPKDFVSLDLSDKRVHSWLAGPDIKLHFYTERSGVEPFGSVELILQTTGGPDDAELKGTYQLYIYDPTVNKDDQALELTGQATCVSE
jgi:hypothetical protein